MDVSQYLDIFIDETNEHIQDLSDCIMMLEQEPENKDTINEIFRAAHSLKGMAGTMGFKRMQRLTHDMENVFQEVRSDKMKVNEALIDILFQCLDAIEAYLEEIKNTSNEGTEENEALINSLNKTLEADLNEDTLVTGNGNDFEKVNNQQVVVENDDRLYLKTEILDGDLKKFLDIEEGHHIVGITVIIEDDCLLKAARAFLVFRAVEEIGEILKFDPTSQDIEDEKFENKLSLFVNTEHSAEDVINATLTVSEIASAQAEVLTEAKLNELMKNNYVPGTNTTNTQPIEKATTARTVEKQLVVKENKVEKSTSKKKNVVAKPVTSRTVRVDIEKLDALMNQVSELIIAKNSLVSISEQDGEVESNQTFHEQIEYLERITTGLHESVMKVRMVPIESVVNKFPRMIRDLSRKLDKKMELFMSGEETELDRTVVDQIGDPLQHLLRNSADHGLESAEVRAERGKPAVGSIILNAFQEGNNVVIEVSDDGNGIDTDVVKMKALERGVITEEQAENLTKKEAMDLLFLPSFSMAEEISDISGRGVGLDVVKSNIEALGGDVEVSSYLGKGSKFTVRLPLTLAIIQALMVEIENEKYAIALGSIQNIENILTTDIKYVQAREVITIRGMVIPLFRLDQMLDIQRPEDSIYKDADNLTVVIVKKGDNLAGLVVDQLMGQQEIVIKSIGNYINNNKMISGATILGDGEVALILDANSLI